MNERVSDESEAVGGPAPFIQTFNLKQIRLLSFFWFSFLRIQSPSLNAGPFQASSSGCFGKPSSVPRGFGGGISPWR